MKLKTIVLTLASFGLALASCHIDKIEGNWVQSQSFPGQDRDKPSSFTLQGKGYYGLGYDDRSDVERGDTSYLRDMWQFTPPTDNSDGQWKQVASLPDEALGRNGAASAATTNYGYIMAGYSDNLDYAPNDDHKGFLNDIWRYDPVTNSWESKGVVKSLISSDYPDYYVQGATAFAYEDNLYFGLGEDFTGKDFTEMMRYDEETETWSSIASLGRTSNGRSYANSCIHNGRVYITGGTPSSIAEEFWVLDLTQIGDGLGQWVQLRDTNEEPYGNTSIPRHSAAMFGYDFILPSGETEVHLYLTGGSAGYKDTYEWNLQGDRWQTVEPHEGNGGMNQAVFEFGEGETKTVYIVGGDDSIENWEFRPLQYIDYKD